MNVARAQYARLGIVAEWLGVSPRTLQRDLARGYLHRHGKNGGVLLVDLQEVRRLYRLDAPTHTIDDIVNDILRDVRPTRRVSTTEGRE